MSNIDEDNYKLKVSKYYPLKPVYEAYAVFLRELLESAVRDLGISAEISARAKGVPNFAEKILRKPKTDPVNEFTDLCGARVIVHYLDEIEPVCNFIRRNFEIDEANSEDTAARLGVSSFGYRSVHFIVSLKQPEPETVKRVREKLCGGPGEANFAEHLQMLGDRWSSEDEESKSNPLLIPGSPKFRAEIQVRTMLEHAWATFAHDRIYKSEFKIPEKFQRDTNRIAAVLENINLEFSRTMRGLETYRSNYGAYMSRELRLEEIIKLELILTLDPENVRLARKIARLKISLELWDEAYDTLSRFIEDWKNSAHGRALQDLAKKTAHPRKWTLREEEEIAEWSYRLRDPNWAILLYDAGVARTQGGARLDGRELLEWSILAGPDNVDARVALAQAARDQHERRELYEKAFAVCPSDPKALAGNVQCKIDHERGLEFVSFIRSSLEQALMVCRERADIGIDLPEALYNMGLFHLVLGNLPQALAAYAAAVLKTDSATVIIKQLEAVRESRKSIRVSDGVEMFEQVELLLELALAVRPFILAEQVDAAIKAELAKKAGKEKEIESLHRETIAPEQMAQRRQQLNEEIAKAEAAIARNQAQRDELIRHGEKYRAELSQKYHEVPGIAGFKENVVIVSGGTSRQAAAKINEYRDLLRSAFQGFSGLIISGGTADGVCGIVGDLSNPDNKIRRIAFFPGQYADHAKIHPGYDENFHDHGVGWSPRQPLLGWARLILSGVSPRDVKVLGINGGLISAFEYRIGIMLGAKVGVIRESGRAATDITNDPDWNGRGLLQLPADLQTLRVFLRKPPQATFLSAGEREAEAQKYHEKYLADKRKKISGNDRALVEWKDLPADLKESNYNVIDYVEEKLKHIGLGIEKSDSPDFPVYVFSPTEIEAMAEFEHGRWNVYTSLTGYKYGPEKDEQKMTHNCLLPYDKLSDDIKHWDRINVEDIALRLKEKGYKVVRKTDKVR